MQARHAQGELLAQVRPSVTTPVTLFTAILRTEITLILAAIPSSGPNSVDVSLYHDVNGTTFNDSNLVSRKTRSALTGDESVFQAQHPGSGVHLAPGDSLGIQISSANNVVMTLYGITESIAEYKE